MDLQIKSKVPYAGKSRSWNDTIFDEERMTPKGPRRDCPDAEGDALRLDVSRHLSRAGQAWLQPGECHSESGP